MNFFLLKCLRLPDNPFFRSAFFFYYQENPPLSFFLLKIPPFFLIDLFFLSWIRLRSSSLPSLAKRGESSPPLRREHGLSLSFSLNPSPRFLLVVDSRQNPLLLFIGEGRLLIVVLPSLFPLMRTNFPPELFLPSDLCLLVRREGGVLTLC